MSEDLFITLTVDNSSEPPEDMLEIIGNRFAAEDCLIYPHPSDNRTFYLRILNGRTW